jgi:ring-1,2-phenylacetyl-CoA epoxidase subunit PaaE
MIFYTLPIKEINRETNDCVSITFNVPQNLKENFTYLQGQYLTLKTNINNQEVRRSYSICSSPIDGELSIAVKKVKEGLFSTYANEVLKVNDTLEVAAPQGKFYSTLQANNCKKYIAIAAGSGITPILSIIKTTLAIEPRSNFILVYGNKNTGSIIFKEQLEALKNKNLGRLQLIHILSREKTDAPINSGRIDEEKLHQLSKLIDWKSTDEVFMCGPEEMIITTKAFLENKGVDKKQIHLELFTTTAKIKKAKSVTVADKKPKSKVSIKTDGRTFDIEIGFDEDQSILDAALQNGADLPFACKGGVCCTCKAKLLEGKVEMDVNWGLEHEELEQGYILTCQAHPTTEIVVIDFDG